MTTISNHVILHFGGQIVRGERGTAYNGGDVTVVEVGRGSTHANLRDMIISATRINAASIRIT